MQNKKKWTWVRQNILKTNKQILKLTRKKAHGSAEFLIKLTCNLRCKLNTGLKSLAGYIQSNGLIQFCEFWPRHSRKYMRLQTTTGSIHSNPSNCLVFVGRKNDNEYYSNIKYKILGTLVFCIETENLHNWILLCCPCALSLRYPSSFYRN